MSLNQKFEELGEALKHYARTGEVLRCLMAAFDERGRFIPQPGWDLDGYQARRIESQTLYLPDMYETDDFGNVHYLGSVRGSKGSPPIMDVNYTTVGGFIKFSGNVLNAPKLKSVGWGFSIDKVFEVDFPELEYVGGRFDLEGCYGEVSLPKLEYVGESLKASGAKSLFLPRLKKVDGSLFANEAKVIIANQLEEVVGSIFALRATDLQLRRLREVKDALQFDGFTNLGVQRVLRSLSDACLKRLSQEEDIEDFHQEFKKELDRRVLERVKTQSFDLGLG